MLESAATWMESIGPYEVQMRATTCSRDRRRHSQQPSSSSRAHWWEGTRQFLSFIELCFISIGFGGQDPRTACKIVVAF